MNNIGPLFVLVLFISSCVPTDHLSELKEADQVVVKNLIVQTYVKGEGAVIKTKNDLSITVKPIDTREFDNALNTLKLSDGRHISIVSSVEGMSLDKDSSNFEDSTRIALKQNLKSKLINEQFSVNEINKIMGSIFEETETEKNLFVYTNPKIYVNNYNRLNKNNPFVEDDRYLSVVELRISNNSKDYNSVCEEDLFIKSDQNIYKNIPTYDLLQRIPTGSIRHEFLYSMLLKNCEIIPANSKVKTYLIFPFIYKNEKLKIYYMSRDSLIHEDLNIMTKKELNEYTFSNMNIKNVNKSGYEVPTSTRPDRSTKSHSYSTTRNHFLKVNDSIKHIGFEDFFIHNDINLNFIEVVSILIENDEKVEIYRTPLSKENISSGSIKIEE